MKRLIACLLLSTASLFSQTYACTQNAILSTTSSGVQQVIAAPTGSHQIRICAIYFQVTQQSTPANFGLVQGTGVNCATSQAQVTPRWTGIASAIQTYTQEIPTNTSIFLTAGYAACLNLSAAPKNANIQILWDTY